MKNWKIGVVCAGLLAMCSCKKPKEEPNPCASQKPVSAGFKIYESNAFEGLHYVNMPLVDLDTVSGSAIFVADEPDAEYHWEIGSEKYNTKSVFLRGFPTDEPVPIKLSVTKKPNLSCFPLDNGMDTVTRVVVSSEKSKILDVVFKGKIDGNREANLLFIKKEFQFFDYLGPYTNEYYAIINWRFEGDTILLHGLRTGGRIGNEYFLTSLYTDTELLIGLNPSWSEEKKKLWNCYPSGYLILKRDQTLEAEITFHDRVYDERKREHYLKPVKKEKFIGKRK